MSVHFKIFLLAATTSFICLIDILDLRVTNMKAQITDTRFAISEVQKNQNIVKGNGFKTKQLKID